MIVQRSQEDAHFVIGQTDHARAAGQFARAFGGGGFTALEQDLIVAVTQYHDEGWTEVDAALHFDAQTGLPYHLFDTPFELSLQTNVCSPDYNERRHPLCGILSSMHTCGFYNGRYGLMEPKSLDALSENQKAELERMLEGEEARQARLKAELKKQGRAQWTNEAFLLRAYYALQFFDLLALYFHLRSSGARASHSFKSVPTNKVEVIDITLTPLEDAHYCLKPYPFSKDPLTVATKGRYLTPQSSQEALRAHVAEAEPSYQKVTLTA